MKPKCWWLGAGAVALAFGAAMVQTTKAGPVPPPHDCATTRCPLCQMPYYMHMHPPFPPPLLGGGFPFGSPNPLGGLR